MRAIRSLLFAPANRPDLIRKFLRHRADVFAIDLEDSVPENEKPPARRELPSLVAYLRENGLNRRLFVRINGIRSPHRDADLAAILNIPIDGVLMPKLETTGDLGTIGVAHPVIGIIESATGV